jgi:acetolactate synthase regulatory subunit
VSLDYAIIAAQFHTVEEALRRCESMHNAPEGDPPPAVSDLVEELDRIDAISEESGFLAMWPVDSSALGAIVCTRTDQWPRTIRTVLDMTKDRGLAVVDLQMRQVFDPRGRIDAHATAANGITLPYLTEQILRDVMARQHHYGDHIVVERSDGHYIQALYQVGRCNAVEYRDGGPDRHYPH